MDWIVSSPLLFSHHCPPHYLSLTSQPRSVSFLTPPTVLYSLCSVESLKWTQSCAAPHLSVQLAVSADLWVYSLIGSKSTDSILLSERRPAGAFCVRVYTPYVWFIHLPHCNVCSVSFLRRGTATLYVGQAPAEYAIKISYKSGLLRRCLLIPSLQRKVRGAEHVYIF